MKPSNRWNRFIYGLWSPVYDCLAGFFRPGRERAVRNLELQSGERVLLLGIGTGLDLPLLPPGVQAVGLDLSRAMLNRARARWPLREPTVSLVVGDAQALPFKDECFDTAVLTLILSVVPDGAQCLRETVRVLRPGGRGVVFDKFLPDGRRPSTVRRLFNLLTSFFGTDINRRFGDMTVDLDCIIESEEPSLLRGAYKIVLLRKPDRRKV